MYTDTCLSNTSQLISQHSMLFLTWRLTNKRDLVSLVHLSPNDHKQCLRLHHHDNCNHHDKTHCNFMFLAIYAMMWSNLPVLWLQSKNTYYMSACVCQNNYTQASLLLSCTAATLLKIPSSAAPTGSPPPNNSC